MSYILDALKKSELERTRNAAPSLIATAPVPTRTRARVLITIAAALFANAVIFGVWWLWPKTVSNTPAAEMTVTTGADAPASIVAETTPTTPAPEAAASLPATVAPPRVPTVQPPPVASIPPPAAKAKPTPAPRVDKPIPFNALSPDEQHAFDGLTFSTHLFADDPSFRAVTVNGRQYKEGDTLANGLLLSEITEEGVVIESRGKRVELSILQDWRL
jgi:general secretion pathway protein B